jgi:hypothetical protein
VVVRLLRLSARITQNDAIGRARTLGLRRDGSVEDERKHTMNTSRRHAGVVGLAAAALALAGCGGGTSERVVEGALAADGVEADVEVDDDGGFSVETEDGSVSTSASIPEDWPDDVPIPEGFELALGGEASDAGGVVVSVNGVVDMDDEQLDAFYAEALDGWDEVARFGAGTSFNVQYVMGERALTISATTDASGTTLSVTHATSTLGTDGEDTSGANDGTAEDDSPETDGAGSDGSADDAAAGTDGATVDGLDIDGALAGVGLESKGDALVIAAGAERYEVVGSTLHVYFGDEASVPAGVECIVVSSVLSEGEQAVVHRDGTETEC